MMRGLSSVNLKMLLHQLVGTKNFESSEFRQGHKSNYLNIHFVERCTPRTLQICSNQSPFALRATAVNAAIEAATSLSTRKHLVK